ncbi:MAG TPA: hypothetical protein VGQ20_05525, partial [Acidimicrobiales bacterium]|nr:hypothetical protein [Acidimicrobiales bacterium]
MKRTLLTGGIAAAVAIGTLVPAGAAVLGWTDRAGLETETVATTDEVATTETPTSTEAPRPDVTEVPGTAAPPTTEVETPATTEAPRPTEPERPAVDAFRLECKLRTTGFAIVCDWAEPEFDGVRGYRVWRSVNDAGRVPIGETARRAWVDERIEPGHGYRYVIEALGQGGETLGWSVVAGVRVPERTDALRLACVAKLIDGRQTVVCEWSESTRPDVRAYRLVRRLGDRPRETVAEIPADGRRRVVDTAVEPGQRWTYGVLALDGDGKVIGEGGPVAVSIPRFEPAPTTTTTVEVHEPVLTTTTTVPTGQG